MRRVVAGVGGALAVAMAVGSFATLRWDNARSTPRRVVFSNPSAATNPAADRVPVFYIENATAVPTSCDDVKVEKTTTGLFRAVATSADGKQSVRVTVQDDLPAASDSTSADAAAAAKSIPGRLRLEAQAIGGLDAEDIATAKESLSRAELAIAGDPRSLTVSWPAGFHETSREVPWAYSGYLQDGIPQRMYRFDSPDDQASADDDADVIDPEELFASLNLSWNSVDDFNRVFRHGFILTDNPAPPVFAFRTIDGFAVGISLAEEGATQAKVDELAANIRVAPFMCAAEIDEYATDLNTMIRVDSNDWVAHLNRTPNNPSPENPCAIPDAVVDRGGTSRASTRSHNCSPGGTFTLAKDFGFAPQPDRVTFVANAPVASIRLREPSGRVLTSYPVFRATGSTFGIASGALPKVSGVGVLVVEAFDAQGTLVEAASYQLGCRYRDACSPLHRLLDNAAIPVNETDTTKQTRLLYLGTTDLPANPWPSYDTSVGSVDLATTSKQWCALLDITAEDSFGPNTVDQDGMANCIPVDTLRPDTLSVSTETLDYVGVLTMSVVVVGSDVSQVRVGHLGSSKIFAVHRTEPGPGAVAFSDPSHYDDESPVGYEALDATGRIIAETQAR